MTLDISFQPMRVLIDGHDSEGNLVLAANSRPSSCASTASTMTLNTRGGGTWKPGSASATFVTRRCSRHLRKPEPGLNKS